MAGIGVVIYDSEGEVIAALLERISLPPSVEDVEAMACQPTMHFALEIGIRDVVFEGDSEVIFKHLTSDSDCLAAFGNLVDDSRRAAANFISCSFSHVKRKGNAVADNLAKLAKHSIAPQIWLEDIHSDECCYQSCDI